jgi:hypothetical protein
MSDPQVSKIIPHRLLRVSMALLMAATAILMPAPIASAESHIYAGHRSPNPSGATGVNGYVRHSGTIMTDCFNQFLAAFLSIGTGSPSNKWVQIGHTQGTLLDNCSSSAARLYAEQNDCNRAKYALWDLGQTPVPNYPVYVNSTSVTQIDPCTQGLDTQWAFRVGSLTSAPKAYGYVYQVPSQVDALQELMWTTSRPEINANRFGLNDAGQVQSGYGISVRKSGTWNAWTPTWVPGSYMREDAPLNVIQTRAYYAFQVHD